MPSIGANLQTIADNTLQWLHTYTHDDDAKHDLPRNSAMLQSILRTNWLFILGTDLYPKYQEAGFFDDQLTDIEIDKVTNQIMNVCFALRNCIPQLIFADVPAKEAFVKKIGETVKSYTDIYWQLRKKQAKKQEVLAADGEQKKIYSGSGDYSSLSSSMWGPSNNNDFLMYYWGMQDSNDPNLLLWWCSPSYRQACLDEQLIQFFFKGADSLAHGIGELAPKVEQAIKAGAELELSVLQDGFELVTQGTRELAKLTHVGDVGKFALQIGGDAGQILTSITRGALTDGAKLLDISGHAAHTVGSALSNGAGVIEHAFVPVSHFVTDGLSAGVDGCGDLIHASVHGLCHVGHAVSSCCVADCSGCSDCGICSSCGSCDCNCNGCDCRCDGCGECCGATVTVGGGGAGVIGGAVSGTSADSTGNDPNNKDLHSLFHHGASQSSSHVVTSHATWSKFFAITPGSAATLIYTILLAPPVIVNFFKNTYKLGNNLYQWAAADKKNNQIKAKSKRNAFAAFVDLVFGNGFGVAGFFIGLVIPFGGPHTAIALAIAFSYLGNEFTKWLRTRSERKAMGGIKNPYKYAPDSARLETLTRPPGEAPTEEKTTSFSIPELLRTSMQAQKVYDIAQFHKKAALEEQEIVAPLKPNCLRSEEELQQGKECSITKSAKGVVLSYASTYCGFHRKNDAYKEAMKNVKVLNGEKPDKVLADIKFDEHGKFVAAETTKRASRGG